VGANSLINRDLEPWTVYVGSPVRAIRPRPKEKMLELEAQLRRDLYDAEGRYIPKHRRK
ncbi:MAG: acyltransferase, partial [Chloroflexi bacterium]|nr:acyltransferase [Chloroflexota bacterium]